MVFTFHGSEYSFTGVYVQREQREGNEKNQTSQELSVKKSVKYNYIRYFLVFEFLFLFLIQFLSFTIICPSQVCNFLSFSVLFLRKFDSPY